MTAFKSKVNAESLQQGLNSVHSFFFSYVQSILIYTLKLPIITT